MQWGPQQARALDAIGRWLQTHDRPVFRLDGYAGTGKTTLAKHAAELTGDGGDVVFCAPTGKAADVLRRKGCTGASTIHSLIYKVMSGDQQRLRELSDRRAELVHELRTEEYPHPEQDPAVRKIDKLIELAKEEAGRPTFQLNPESPIRDARLVIADERSMMGAQVWSDLLSFKVPVLALGDPYQLPPVRQEQHAAFADDRSDALLTEVHRTALDSPVLRLATRIRERQECPEGETLDPRDGAVTSVQKRRKLAREEVLAFDQLLVGKNATRVDCNKKAREHLGRLGPAPQLGDRLVCLKNNRELGLFNGQLWTVLNADAECFDGESRKMLIRAVDEERDPIEVHALEECFWAEKAPAFIDGGLTAFTFSYALTVHKAQGSEWPSVLVWGDWGGSDYWRWLYTAVTRARSSLRVML